MTSSGSSVLYGAIPPALKLSAAEKRALHDFANSLSGRVAAAQPFVCLLSGDDELRRLNRQFLSHDYATDVLSFPALDPASGLGEIAISVERAQAQSAAFGHSCLDEIRILMLHGLLHLTGLDHETDQGAMARAEKRWRSEFALPTTLIARSRTKRLTA